jgi:hypothetical protein
MLMRPSPGGEQIVVCVRLGNIDDHIGRLFAGALEALLQIPQIG